MAIRRTTGVIPGGGSVTLQGLPVRKSFWFQAQGNNNMQVAFASGFTLKNLVPGAIVTRTLGGGETEALQGAIVITGTPGDAYDAEETYS